MEFIYFFLTKHMIVKHSLNIFLSTVLYLTFDLDFCFLFVF